MCATAKSAEFYTTASSRRGQNIIYKSACIVQAQNDNHVAMESSQFNCSYCLVNCVSASKVLKRCFTFENSLSPITHRTPIDVYYRERLICVRCKLITLITYLSSGLNHKTLFRGRAIALCKNFLCN
jgi:hypothetical protein